MLCLELFINGKRQALAGSASAESICASFNVAPQIDESWLKLEGEVIPESGLPADASWLSSSMSVGDRVEIRLVQSNTPDLPELSRTDPDTKDIDTIPVVCAFCRKDHKELEGVIASGSVYICHGCIRYLHEMISND